MDCTTTWDCVPCPDTLTGLLGQQHEMLYRCFFINPSLIYPIKYFVFVSQICRNTFKFETLAGFIPGGLEPSLDLNLRECQTFAPMGTYLTEGSEILPEMV
jgi:hypothetical protein